MVGLYFNGNHNLNHTKFVNGLVDHDDGMHIVRGTRRQLEYLSETLAYT